jgi:hypothetical protein
MTRALNRLSDRRAKTAKPGMHCGGGGLYLHAIRGTDREVRRSWLFRFATGEVRLSENGKPYNVERQMGLGSFPDTSLAEAREKAAQARKLREQGIFRPCCRPGRSAGRAGAGIGQGRDLRLVSGWLYRVAPGWVGLGEARHAMGYITQGPCIASVRGFSGRDGGHGVSAESIRADLGYQACNRPTVTRADRKRFGLGKGSGLS